MKKLIDIVAKLRSTGGCPWDRKQNHSSLVTYLLEETWEVIDEIEHNRIDDTLKEELGDLLLQVVLHAQIAQEDHRFTIADVVDAISEKMITRHPHVFSQENNTLSEKELKQQWYTIKSEEKDNSSTLDGIPTGAPALMTCLAISKRAAALGFDWETPWDVLLKVKEELEEVRQEMENGDVQKIEEEIGDLLFSITNLARYYQINPEIALKKGNDKFRKRFLLVEKAIKEASRQGNQLTLEELEIHWKAAKLE